MWIADFFHYNYLIILKIDIWGNQKAEGRELEYEILYFKLVLR